MTGRICTDIHGNWVLHYYENDEPSSYKAVDGNDIEDLKQKAKELGLTAVYIGNTTPHERPTAL